MLKQIKQIEYTMIALEVLGVEQRIKLLEETPRIVSIGSGASGGGGAELAIGSPVTSGTPNAVLYIDPSGNLGQSPDYFAFDEPTKYLSVPYIIGTQNENSGILTLMGAAGTVGSVTGGDVQIQSGDGFTAGNGGEIYIIPGAAGAGGNEGHVGIYQGGFGNGAIFDTDLLTSNRTFTFPNTSGLFAIVPPATDKYVLFSDNDVLGADSGLQYDKNIYRLTISNIYLGGQANSVPAWGTSGVAIQTDANGHTDTTSSGTVAEAVIYGFARHGISASSVTTYTNAASIYIEGPPIASTNVTFTNSYALWVDSGNVRFDGSIVLPSLTQGSVLFAGSGGTISQDNSSLFFDDTNNFLGIGTATPAAQLNLAGNITAAAWTTNGIGLRINAATYTDSSSSGTVASMGAHSILVPTVAASSSTTYTTAATLYIANAPTAGSNVTITGGLALWVDNGNVQFDGGIGAGGFGGGSSSSAKYNFGIAHSLAAVSWGTNGVGLRLNAGTVTDTTTADNATVSTANIHSILRPTIAATNAATLITYTTAATLYIQNSPTTSGNVAITNPLSLHVAAGNVVFNGSLGVGASASNPTEVLQINGNLTTTAWTTNGVRLRAVGRTYTDTSSSGTVTTVAIDALGRPTLAASNTVTYTTAATFYIVNAPTIGSNVTVTNNLAMLIDDGDVRMDGRLSVNSNSNSPTAALEVRNLGISAAAWGTSGIWTRVVTGIATDTSTADAATVTSTVFHSFSAGTLNATNAATGITYSDVGSVYIAGPTTAGTNVNITRNWALWVNSGNTRFLGNMYLGAATGNAVSAVLHIDSGNQNLLQTFGASGSIIRAAARTLTDTTSSGTVAAGVVMSLAAYTFAASSSTTITDAATLYIAGAPAAGTNMTLTSAWSLWLDAGNARLDGAVQIGSLTTLTSGTDLQVTNATGAIVTIGRNDTSVTAADSLGKIRFYSNDTSTTSNLYAAEIEVIAENTISTDINPGSILFKTTTSGVAGALTERLRIDSAGAFTIADASNFIFNTSTGTKFGTATTQKIGFYNATPVVQQTGNIKTALSNLGLVTSGTYDAGDISAGTLAIGRGGTGITTAGNRQFFVHAAGMWTSTTAGCAALAKVETSTNKVNYQTLDFDAATDEFAEFAVCMPDNWDASTITYKIMWTATSGSGDVIWGLQATSLANDDAIDTAWGTAVTVTDTLTAAADLDVTPTSSALTIGNTPSAGEYVQFRVYRDADAGGDTLGVDARLIGIMIEYGVSAYTT